MQRGDLLIRRQTRVAQERCESFGRDGEGTVGYQIRGERRGGRHLVFATTGVLLRRLQGDPTLGGISHVVIDEG